MLRLKPKKEAPWQILPLLSAQLLTLQLTLRTLF
jgi:hypothetical protein